MHAATDLAIAGIAIASTLHIYYVKFILILLNRGSHE